MEGVIKSDDDGNDNIAEHARQNGLSILSFREKNP